MTWRVKQLERNAAVWNDSSATEDTERRQLSKQEQLVKKAAASREDVAETNKLSADIKCLHSSQKHKTNLAKWHANGLHLLHLQLSMRPSGKSVVSTHTHAKLPFGSA